MNIDQSLLLWFNGGYTPFLDHLAIHFTSAFTWALLYLSLLYIVIKNSTTRRQLLLTLACVALCLLLSDGLPDGIVKPLVARLRPSHDPALRGLVHLVGGQRNTPYGFFSAHASNTFSLALFFGFLVRRRSLMVVLVTWSLINCWTRLYLGFHYPSDILVGLVWGAASGSTAYYVYRKTLEYHFHTPVRRYTRASAGIPVVVFLLTTCYLIVQSLAVSVT